VREDDPTLQQEVSDRQTACHAEVENVCWRRRICGKIISTLWRKYPWHIHCTCNYIFWEKIERINFAPLLVLCCQRNSKVCVCSTHRPTTTQDVGLSLVTLSQRCLQSCLLGCHFTDVSEELMMAAVGSPKTSAHIYRTTRSHDSEEGNINPLAPEFSFKF
jgi:hypothetical protein